MTTLHNLGAAPDPSELRDALKQMANGRSPGPDGILTEFYAKFWHIIGDDFTSMIREAIAQGTLPMGMNQGLVVLLPKEGDREFITNWRPITLLNSSYKILAKVLQIRLQRLLPEVIHPGQSAFLPTRHILDSIMTQHKTISWARNTHQPLIMLKLDFSKAYDTVRWSFLFRVMAKMGLPTTYI